MSIPYKDSPFQRGLMPCKKCEEKDGKLICALNSNPCEHARTCRFYSPYSTTEYQNNMSKSLRPSWVEREYDTYYVEECSCCRSRVPRNPWNSTYYSKYCPSCGKHLYVEGQDVTDIEPGIYQHFKGRHYKVLEVAEHTETEEKFVIYQALYGQYKVYARPLKMFAEDVEDIENKYRGPRFFKIETIDT